jgi:hypothetical protein
MLVALYYRLLGRVVAIAREVEAKLAKANEEHNSG